MATQDAVTNAIAALSGSAATIVAGTLAVLVLWVGAECVMNTFDFHLPLRQLMLGRSVGTLTVHARYLYCVAAGRVAGMFLPRRSSIRWIVGRPIEA